MDSNQHIDIDTLAFLSDLAENNNREWFNAHKQRYQTQHQKVITFAEDLLKLMQKHDQISTVSGKKSLFRIYRDVRFSKDKQPYKTHFSGSFKRATEQLRGGYYFHVEPGNSFIAGGFFNPEKDDLLRIRQEISFDARPLRTIISDSHFSKVYGEFTGETLKTTPKGFEKDHPDIDLLRHKSFHVVHHYADDEVLKADFAAKVSEHFQVLRPFFDYMSEILTTDANGMSTV